MSQMGICFYGGIEQEVCVRRMHWAANAGRLGVFLNYCVTNEHFEIPGFGVTAVRLLCNNEEKYASFAVPMRLIWIHVM